MPSRKKVAVLVRRSPLNTVKGSEALRQSVGLTLADNDVSVFLLDGAAWLATPVSPALVGMAETKKHVRALPGLGVRVVVERESLDSCGMSQTDVMEGVSVVSADEVCSLMAEADAVVVF